MTMPEFDMLELLMSNAGVIFALGYCGPKSTRDQRIKDMAECVVESTTILGRVEAKLGCVLSLEAKIYHVMRPSNLQNHRLQPSSRAYRSPPHLPCSECQILESQRVLTADKDEPEEPDLDADNPAYIDKEVKDDPIFTTDQWLTCQHNASLVCTPRLN
jgi:hypothetical protein